MEKETIAQFAARVEKETIVISNQSMHDTIIQCQRSRTPESTVGEVNVDRIEMMENKCKINVARIDVI